MIATILIGLVAGWLAGVLMKGSGYGVVVDIALGLVGAVVGSFIFGVFNVAPAGTIGYIVMATIGAVVLVAISHAVKRA
ncbi:MAG: GlsB/YeaQ/YmgE family stress response membrane protein [Candidatus Binataceae bacterium]